MAAPPAGGRSRDARQPIAPPTWTTTEPRSLLHDRRGRILWYVANEPSKPVAALARVLDVPRARYRAG